MASDLGRSEAIEITVFHPGDELPPLLATERDVYTVRIGRIADKDSLAQSPYLDTRTRIASLGRAPSQFVCCSTTHYSPRQLSEGANTF